MATIRLEDRRNATTFEGTRIAAKRTAGPDRWAELEIYRTDTGAYVLHRRGMSNLYHREPTTCRTSLDESPGDAATITDLPDDATPCPVCEPPWPQDLADEEQVRYEYPRVTINRCETPEIVRAKLTTYRQHGVTVIRISDLVADLLAEAAANDEKFAALPPLESRLT